MDADMTAHYAEGREGERLRTWGRLEASRTRELLQRFLPPAPAVVLDVGGAEGAYALPLAAQGYTVTLVDPMPTHVEAALTASAQQTPLAGAVVGDARALDAVDGSVDAVLLLGPLYHLIDAEDRARALAEAHRVLRPGGVLLAAGISRFASTLDGLRMGMLGDPAFEAIVQADVSSGVHTNPTRHPAWFTTAYFHHPDDLVGEVRTAGFDDADVYAVEGPVAVDDAVLDDPALTAAALRAIARIEREPSLLGASPHLMAVAHRP